MAEKSPPITLGDEQREVARARILRAACEVLQRQGFRSTVDDVATAAGVSRRTVFRYFPTQGRLLASAARTVLEQFAEHVAPPPPAGGDVDGWLRGVAVQFHRLHAHVVGQMFWDLYANRSETDPELTEVVQSIAAVRRAVGAQLAAKAWAARGKRGKPPAHVTAAITLLFSGFAYEGLAVTVDRAPEKTARISAEIAIAVLDRAASGLAPPD